MKILSTLLFIGLITLCQSTFSSYWNIYDQKCHKRHQRPRLDFDKYGIIHNSDYEFYGDKINIMYNPGEFPIYSKNGEAINGGIPQLGDLELHKTTFRDQLSSPKLIHATQGPLVLDFEVYRPRFQSADELYQANSIEMVRSQHPHWPLEDIKLEAERTFNESSRTFFESILTIAKEERPNALIGYYIYPNCNCKDETCSVCSEYMMLLNDRIQDWLYDESTALYPTLYTKEDGLVATYRNNFMRTRMKETMRVNRNNVPVLPYVNPIFKNSIKRLPKEVLRSILWIIKYYGGQGAVLWAKSDQFETAEQCDDFANYFDGILGPALQCMGQLTEELVAALKRRFPLEDEDGQATNNENTAAENLIDQIVNDPSFVVDSDNVENGRMVIETFCEDYL